MKAVDFVFGILITIAIFGVLGYTGYAFYCITVEVFQTLLVPPAPFLP